jgi:hypothetical protein
MFRTVFGSRNGGARVSNVLGCICKDGVGTITEVEGNINSEISGESHTLLNRL